MADHTKLIERLEEAERICKKNSLFNSMMAIRDAVIALSLPVSNTGEWSVNPLAIEALTKHQRQLDQDGVEVGVSRQALDEILAELAKLMTLGRLVGTLTMERDQHGEELGKVIMACKPGYRKSPASEGVREMRTALETAETLLDEAWRALAPFIRLADNVFSDGKNATVADEVTLWCFNDTDITFGDLRRARATLDRIGK